jgi:hypothetical protein
VKCPQCQTENKETMKSCRKCGTNLQLPPLWQPTWAWHRKTLFLIYVVILGVFFFARARLKPYVRHLPPEITPWLYPHQTFAPPSGEPNVGH